MDYLPRSLQLKELLERKSYFLFGPRQSGKTSMVRRQLPDTLLINLLDSDTFLRLSARPSLLREIIPKETCEVVIDEIQKLPMLLDEVQLLIEERGVRFLLTGSSARKLKRQGVNMLGGRARSRKLHPFVAGELGAQFDLFKALEIGLLPPIYLSDSPSEDLSAYVNDYLQLEIAAEGLTRNLPAFSRFLAVAATTNGQILNYQSVATDAQIAHSTVTEYFRILQDTLIASELGCWQESVKRKAVAKSKFYFFDTGVARKLLGLGKLKRRSPEFGDCFEAYMHHELRSYVDYHAGGSLHYWRTQSSHYEVDFILNGTAAIEIKAKDVVGKKDLRGLEALREEMLLDRYHVVSMEPSKRTLENGIEIWPWRAFLDALWDGSLLS